MKRHFAISCVSIHLFDIKFGALDSLWSSCTFILKDTAICVFSHCEIPYFPRRVVKVRYLIE